MRGITDVSELKSEDRVIFSFIVESLGEEDLRLFPWGEVYDEGVRGGVVGLRGVFNGDAG
jgi:hypothetical protein